MNNTSLDVFESVLELAAEELGDITQPVMDVYYEKFPEAIASFKEHGLDNVARLEATMVETVVYTLMTWFERPVEIEIMLRESVPHHMHVLKIPMNIFYGLVDCTMDIIESVVTTDSKQIAVCKDLREGLTNCIQESEDSRVEGSRLGSMAS